jgi:hypothetical protein
MRAVVTVAAIAAVLLCSGLGRPAGAQPSADSLWIEWEVTNRFRLFRNEADFRRHVLAARAGSVLAAEQTLARGSDGRGWAKDMLGHLCLDAIGAITEACQRDGAKENYLVPQDHRVAVRLAGPVPGDASCTWSFDDGTPPAQQVILPCSEEVRLQVQYGRPMIAAVGVTRADGSVDGASVELRVRDLLIAGLGDSVAAGEGNPDRPIELADEGFCFRRFLGSGLSEYFRPSRAGFQGNKACPDGPVSNISEAAEWSRQGAHWLSPACHRSLYGYQVRTALALAVENPHIAVTFLPLACTGATIEDGILGSQGASDCPPSGRCAGTVPGQIRQLRDLVDKSRRQRADRNLDLILLTVGANDVKFSGLVADVIITSGVERVLFNQGGLIASVPQSQRLLDREFPSAFGKLRTALKPLVGGDLSRVVFVSYGNPALQGENACPGGRDGLDVHPAFTADGARLRQVSDFVTSKFLPKLRALARCEPGANCREPATDRMTLVERHQPRFAGHGLCARSPDDPPFDRECFAANGESFDPDPVSAATAPLACSRRPNEYQPYAPRARWIRTANDSYFTAMTYPRGMSGAMQPINIHDASWGAMSAVYGGAFHPSAEGQAAMADAALPAARVVLDLKPPPEVLAEPLPPPR